MLRKIHTLQVPPLIKQAFDSQSATLYDLGNQFGRACQVGDEALDLVFGKNCWDGFSALRAKPGKFDFIQFDVKNVTIQEEDGAEGPVLGGRRDGFIGGKVDKELFDFGNTHFFWVAFVVKEDVVLYLEEVGIFGTRGVMLYPEGIAILIKKFFAFGIGS